MRRCCKCNKIRGDINFDCRFCSKERSRIYRENNKEKCLKNVRRWRKENPDKVLASKRKWDKTNIMKKRASARLWAKKNPGKINAWAAYGKAAKRKATPIWGEKDIIHIIYELSYKMCVAGLDVHVDHVVPIGGENVCGLHVYNNLRIMDARENMRKNNRFIDSELTNKHILIY